MENLKKGWVRISPQNNISESGGEVQLGCFYPTALKGCRGIVFTHGVRMGGRAAGNSLSGLYLRNRKV